MTDEEASELFEDWDEEEPETLESREAANERSNDHIEQYIARYIADKSAPHHAVLITGRWGIGKTQFVRDLVQRYATENDQQQYVYVSLNGLQSIGDIDSQLAVQLHPVLGTRVAKAAMKAAGVALRYYKIDPEVRITSIANRLGAKLYVFDDLERCEAPIQATLGYINRFVEHGGGRVIIVADETRFDDDHPYHDIKEKVVGQPFEFQAVIRRPLQQFINELGNARIRPILQARFGSILKQYVQSDLNNLRILRQSLWDFGRFADNLTDGQLENVALIDSLLATFMPLSFDYRGNRINRLEIENSSTLVVTGLSQPKDSVERWKKLVKRYPQHTIRDRVLLGKIWADVLVQGFTDQEVIRAACDASQFVAGPGARPSWERLWNRFDEPDDAVDLAIADLEDRFRKREYVIPGEVLHVVGQRIGLLQDGLLPSTTDIVAEARHYIDDLYNTGAISTDNPDGMGLRDGYGGKRIQNHNSPEFREVLQYYKERRDAYFNASLPARAAALVAELRNNVAGFIEKVCYTNRGNFIYRDTPIFAHMNANDLADALVDVVPEKQLAAFSSIRERYDQDALNGTLATERDFLVRLRDRLLHLASLRDGFGRVRIERYTQYHVSRVIDPPTTGEED